MRQLLVILMLVSTLCFGWEKNNVTIFGDTGSVTAILMTDEASTWGLNGTVETDVVKHGDSSEIYELSNIYNPASVASNLMNFDYYTLETTIGITTTENWNWIIYGGKYWPGPTEFVYPSLVYTTAEYHTATQSATCPSDSTEAALKVLIPAGTYEVTYEVTAWVKFTSISAYAFLDFGLDGVYPINFLAYNHLLIRPSGLSAQANVTWLGAWDEFASYTGDLGSVWHKITAKFLHHAASNATTGHLTVLVDDDIVIDNAYWSVSVEGATINRHLGSINIIATPGAYIDSMSFTGYDPSMFPNVTTNSMMFRDGEAGPITLKQLRDIEYVRHLYYTKTNLQTTGEALLNAANLFNTSSFTVPDPFHVNHLDVADSSEIYETTYTVPAAPSFFNNFDTGEAGLDVVDTNYSDVSPLYTWQEGVYGGGADYYSLIYCDSVSVSTPHSAGSMNAYTRMLTTAMDTLETGTTWTATVEVYHTPAGVAYFGPTILPYNTSTWQQFQFEVVLQGNNVWLYQGYGGSSLQLWTSASTSALTWHSYTLSVDLGLDKVRLVVDGTTDSGWIDYTFNADNALAIKTFTIGGYSDGNWMAFDDVLLSNYRTADPVYYKQLVLADEVNGPRRLSELVNDTVTIASIEAAIDTLNAFRLTCETSIAALEAFRGTAEAKFITIEAAIAAFPSVGTWPTLEAMLDTHESAIQALETFRGTAESAIIALQDRDNTQETAIQLNAAKIATVELTINDGMLTSPNIALSPPRTLTWDAFVMWHDGVAYTVASGTQLMTDNAESYLSWDTATHSMTLVSAPPESADGIQVAHAAFQTNEVIDFAGEEIISDLYPHTFHALQEILKVSVVEGLNVYPDTDATSTLDLTMAAGEYYHGANHMHEQASNIDTRTTPMKVWYHNASGDWSYYYNSNVDPNVYDTGTGTAAVTTNKYSKRLFLYASGEVNSVLPTSIYNTEAEGLNANLPAFPPGLIPFPKSTSLVIRQGATTLPTYPSNYWKDERPMIGGNSSSVSGITDHGGLAGLIDDDHTIYALLAGRAGGQTLYGGTAASDNITIESTSNATKGNVLLNPNGGRVAVCNSSPQGKLDITSTDSTPGLMVRGTTAANNSAYFTSAGYGPVIGTEASGGSYYSFAVASGVTPTAAGFTGGTTRFTVKDDGKVGIGTASPQTSELSIVGTGRPQVHIGYNNTSGLHLSDGTVGAYKSWQIDANDKTADALSFTPSTAIGNCTFTTPVVVIKNDGKVGIGTTAPGHAVSIFDGTGVTEKALSIGNFSNALGGVAGIRLNVAASNDVSYNKGAIFYERTLSSGRGDLKFCQDSADDNGSVLTSEVVAIIKNDGKVGIGTTNPAYKLDVYSSSSTDANNTTDGSSFRSSYINLRNRGNSAGIGGVAYSNQIISSNGAGVNFEIYNIGANALVFGTDSTERMRITSAGRVGINTTSPGNTFSIQGIDDTWSENIIGSATAGKSYGMKIAAGTNTSDQAFSVLSYNEGSQYFKILGDGKVTVGTAPSASYTSGKFNRTITGATGTDYWESNYAGSGGWTTRIFKSRGTSASPAAVSLGDELYDIYGYSYDGTTYRASTFLGFYNDGISGTNVSGAFDFELTKDNSWQHVFDLNTSEAIFNDGSYNRDFRVEGDTDGTCLVVDGSADAVGIGTSAPAAKLNVASASTSTATSLAVTDSSLTHGLMLWSGWSTATANQPAIGWSAGENLRFCGGITNWTDGTGYSEKMVILDNGNVGIGDTNPTRDLTVTTTGNTDAMIKTGNTTGYGYLYFGDTGADGRGWVGYYHTDDALYLGSAGATRLTIDSSGRWLNDNLAVNDNEIWENVTDADTGALYMNYRGHLATSDHFRDFYVCDGKTVAMIFADGSTHRVGIHESAPNDDFSVSHADDDCAIGIKSLNTKSGYLWFHDTDGYYRGGITYDNSADAMYLRANGTTRVTIDSSGGLTVPGIAAGAGTYALKWTNSAGTFTKDTSGRKYKMNIKDIALDLSKFCLLKPREFDYKDTKQHDAGFIAEEVNEVYPVFAIKNEKGEPDGVKYDRMVSLLVAKIQELENRIKELEKKNKDQ